MITHAFLKLFSMRLLPWACVLVLLAFCFLYPAAAWADGEQNEIANSGQASEHNQVYVNQLSDSSFLYETSIADLAQADSYYEGQTVMVKGEVVGDRMNDEADPSRCWITLQDDEEIPSVVSVSISKDKTQIIDTYGAYGSKGTTLQVRGTFHLECQEHQGMSDIHADEVSALAEGQLTAPAANPRILVFGVLSVLVGLALFAYYHYRREQEL